MLQGIGVVWLMGVILGLALLMTYILVILGKKRNIKPIYYSSFSVEIRKGESNINRIKEKQPEPAMNDFLYSPDKIYVNLN